MKKLLLFFLITSTAWISPEDNLFALKNLGDNVQEAILEKEKKPQTPSSDNRLVIVNNSDDLDKEPDTIALNDTVSQPAEEPKKPVAPGEVDSREFFLNFENSSLSTLINYVGDLMNYTIIPDKGIEGSKVSLQVREPLNKAGVWNVFLTLLDMANFAIVEIDGIYKIISRDAKHTEPLPAYINVSLENLPDSDVTIRYVTTLRNIPVSEVSDLLASLLSTQSKIIPQSSLNGFIISDKSNNIKSAMRIIQELDQSGLQEQVVVIPLKKVNAADAKQIIDSLRSSGENNTLSRLFGKNAEQSIDYFSPSTKIIAEDRRNLLILLGNIKSIRKIEDFVKEHIDTTLKGTKSPFRIYEFQHADASQICQILKDTVNTQPDSSAGQQAAKYGGIRNGVKYFKPMSFQADTFGNRLIVTCVDDQDWELLKKTIQDLDKPQPQVAIETFIVTISSSENKQLGGQIRNKKHNQLLNGVDFQSAGPTIFEQVGLSPGGTNASILGNLINALGTIGQGTTVFTLGKPADGMWGIFQALQTLSNTSILQKPFLTVANRVTASINVGSTQQVPSSTAVTDSGNGPTGYTQLQVGSNLSFTPQINTDGIITMKVDTNLSQVGASNQYGIGTTTKVLKTSVSVASGQVLVLGGFVETNVTENNNETPLLSKIPVLGWMFKNKKREVSKDYIFYFICPTIIKPRTEPGVELYTKIKLHQATENVQKCSDVANGKDVIHNWFFNRSGENYHHKVVDFANARYQPTTVDIQNDPFYGDNNFSSRTQDDDDNLLDEETSSFEESLVEEIEETREELEQEPAKKIALPLLKEKIASRETTSASKETELKKIFELKPIEIPDKKRNELKELLRYDPLPQPTREKREAMKQLVELHTPLQQKKNDDSVLLQKNESVTESDSERVKEAMKKLLASSRQAYN